MAKAKLIEIGDAVVAALEAGDFETSINVTRRHEPRFDRATLKQVEVTVVARGVTRTIASRGQQQSDYIIDVGVHTTIDPDQELDRIDDLARLMEQIETQLDFQKMAEARWISTEVISVDPLWNVEHLREHHIGSAVSRFTYRLIGD